MVTVAGTTGNVVAVGHHDRRPADEEDGVLRPIPSVSVCVVGTTSGPYLAETVRSVLDQTFRDLEVVVVGDSDAEDARSIGDPRVRFESSAGGRVAADRNLAVQLTRAPLVKVVRPLDLLHPRCLELQTAAMDSDPGLAVVAARWHIIDEQSRVLLPRRGLPGLIGLYTGVAVAGRVRRDGANPIGGASGVLFRRDKFLSAGWWHDTDPAVVDLDLWMRLLQYGDFLGLPEPLAAARIDRDAKGDAGTHARRALLDELDASGAFPMRTVDRTFGRLVAATRSGRRRVLHALAGVPGGSAV